MEQDATAGAHWELDQGDGRRKACCRLFDKPIGRGSDEGLEVELHVNLEVVFDDRARS